MGVVLDKCKRRLGKYFEVRNSTLHRQSLWRESKSSERDFLVKSEAVASKFSRGETLVLGSRKSEEVKTSLVYLAPKGEERTGALRAGAQKFMKNLGSIMGFYTRKYRLAFKQDPLWENQVG